MTLRRSPLKRGTSQLKRSGPLTRKTRLKQKRAKPRRSDRVRDKAHLAWIRSLPCCACGRRAPSEAHHDTEKRGMGQKADDTRTLPLCRFDHDGAQHYRGAFKGWNKERMRAWFEEKLAHVMALKEEHMKLTELPKEDVDLILVALGARATQLREDLPFDPPKWIAEKAEIVAARCDELAERIRGAA